MNNSSSRNFSKVFVNNLVVTGLHATFYLIFASLLDPELYGNMSYLIAIAGTVSVISRFGLPHTITVFQSKQNQNTSNQINVLAVITTSVAAIVLLFVNPYVSLLTLAISFFVMNQHNLLGLKNYKSYLRMGVLKSILIITLPILFYFLLDLPGILLGMAIGNLICSYNFLKSLSLKINSFYEIKSHIKVIIHNFGIDSSISLTRVLDKLIIVPLFGFTYTGIYQFNLQILFVLMVLPTALHSFLLTEESSGRKHSKIILIILLASTLLTIVSIIIAPYFVSEFFPKYSEGMFGLQIMILSLIPISVSSIYQAKLQAKESTRVGLSSVARIGSLLALVVIFGNWYGIVGLSLAVFISSIFETIILIVLYKNQKDKF